MTARDQQGISKCGITGNWPCGPIDFSEVGPEKTIDHNRLDKTGLVTPRIFRWWPGPDVVLSTGQGGAPAMEQLSMCRGSHVPRPLCVKRDRSPTGRRGGRAPPREVRPQPDLTRRCARIFHNPVAGEGQRRGRARDAPTNARIPAGMGANARIPVGMGATGSAPALPVQTRTGY